MKPGGGVFFYKPEITGTPGGYYDWVGARKLTMGDTGGAMHQTTSIQQAELQYGRYDGSLRFLIQFNDLLNEDTRLFIHLTKPVVQNLQVYPPVKGNQAALVENRIEGIVELSDAGIEPQQEVWFFFQFEPSGKPAFSLPQDSELYLQGYTTANASIYWFL